MRPPQHRRAMFSVSGAGFATWMTWAYIASLGVSRVLQWGGTPNRPVAIWQALLPWQMLVAFVFVVIAAVQRRWKTLGALVVAYASLLPLVLAWQFHGSRTVPGTAPTFTIVTANVLYNNPNLEAAFEELAAVDADVVVMLEMTVRGRAELDVSALASGYQYRSDDPNAIGIVVLSRFPISSESAGDWVTGESQAITLDIDGQEVRLIASHPPPPVFTTEIWDAELRTIGNDVKAFDAPTAVVGDLNAGWALPPFRAMVADGDLTDAMAASGHPWTMTWPNERLPRFAFVTLDHILVNKDLGVFEASAIDVTGSDHKAIVAELVLPRPADG